MLSIGEDNAADATLVGFAKTLGHAAYAAMVLTKKVYQQAGFPVGRGVQQKACFSVDPHR